MNKDSVSCMIWERILFDYTCIW